MKNKKICADCDCCKRGYFESEPDSYVCIGVKNPFIIKNIFQECTEYNDEDYARGQWRKEEGANKMCKYVRPSKDDYYLDIAIAVSRRSTCLKRHYGCVIVKDDIIIATGYNGSVRGMENCCDRGTCKRKDAKRYTNYEKCDSVHAEQNALIAASRDRLIGATAYIACEEFGYNQEKSDLWEEEVYDFHEDKTLVPCGICARMLKNAGIARVVNRSGEVCL